jgi:hypothetical protein
MADAERLRGELYAAVKNRALMYWHVFDELGTALGESQEAGVADPGIATLCRIAGRVVNGTFEAAGFQFSADTWRPGHDGCRHLHIRPGAR